MQVNIEQLEKLARKARFELPMAPVEKDVETRLKDIAKKSKVQGFRPGKAPVKVVEQQHGEGVRREVVHHAIQTAFSKMVRENNLDIVGEPQFNALPVEGDNPTTLAFEVVFDVKPEISLDGLTSVELERPTLEIADAEVDKTLETLRKRHPTYTPVDRASQAGDRLVIDFAGTLDGVAFEGGSAKGAEAILGDGRFLPDFEKGLEGHKVGETFTFDVNFPEDYQAKNLAGKTAQFEITLQELGEPVYPEMNADFIKALGIADGDIDKLRADIKGNLEAEVASRLRERIKRLVIEKVSGAVDFDLPESMVATEQQQLLASAYQELIRRGLSEEDGEMPEDKFRAAAEDRVKTRLIFDHVIVGQGLEPKADLVRARVTMMARAYQDPDGVIKSIYANAEQLNSFRLAVLEDQVIEYLLGQMKVVDAPIAFSEIMPSN